MKSILLHLCLLLLCFPCLVTGQTNKLYNLKQQLASATTDEQRLQFLFAIGEQRYSLSTDTLCSYASEAKAISNKLKNPIHAAWSDYYSANCFVKRGKLDTALAVCNQHIPRLEKMKDGIAPLCKLIALRAQVHIKSNRYKEGLEDCYQLLAIAEKNNDTLNQVIAKTGIGWVYMEMAQPAQGLRWFFKAMHTSNNPAIHQKSANIYSNIAAVYIDLGKLDSAALFIDKAIDLARRDENLFFLSNSLNIYANILIAKKQAHLAEAPLQEAIALREKVGDPYYIVSDLSQLAIFYANHNQPAKGIETSKKGIDIASKYNLLAKLPYLHHALAQNYKAAGDHVRYAETLERIITLKDSVYQVNSETELAALRLKYDQQKQENIIIQQKLDINQKNMVLYGTLIIVFFAVIISAILLNNYKKKQKLVLENVKEQEKQKAEEAVRIAEEKERRRISADLHDNLGAYASAIAANVDELLLPHGQVDVSVIDSIKNNADEIMQSLRETIWVLNKNNIRITSVSDRFKSFVGRLRDAYPEFHVQFVEEIDNDVPLSPEYALNMLRIMQEAFHNAIKHSNGDQITICITSNEKISVAITDNGVGFSTLATNHGNGMTNMQKRASANGWQLIIKSKQPKGTAVELVS
ncbi:tetratricopeptide repeat-containing sensor histidine kinase [Aridibaculum aurantiacum]|uniref:tetratricopeptide repeat-containing sensor histidine kinase n=1 Tax=Aridibaculum aurantiacum TaxID=2810307 RepID=UPI001A960DE0|nr:tetratricopeptide repeat-containing sensor histidine kinase [Aridibaculum aurantiacum]